MSNDKLYYGSVCLTDLADLAKKGHSGIIKAQNGKLYANIQIWVNQEPNKIGQHIAVKMSKRKDSLDETPYIGGAKLSERPKVTESDLGKLDGLNGLSPAPTANPVNTDEEPWPTNEDPF